ncbi:heat shock protein HtpX [Halorubrum alkaliphilum]|uniref:Heat shock protein HtpX n=1 Tax=Halorubrum alkaliphilum TaxID=261290 RepID=A0A8T4GD96_9EURY|nr:M48 family metalloprotease [Halorubrum alkaliphilum]MBP1922418.1 heat shock protein HtpX [Halorubrum alkaliphilum]
MARFAFRLVAATVGVGLIVAYLLAALLVVEGMRYLGSLLPSLVELVALLVVATLVSTYVGYRFGTSRLVAAIETDRLSRERTPQLHRRLDGLVARMDVDRPALYVADLRAPNAFAVGGSEGGALVVDRSLFRLLPPPELGGILAHELAHLEGNDGLTAAIVDGFARTATGIVTLAALPALLSLSGLAHGTAWIRGRPGDRSGLFARLHRTLSNALFAGFVLATLLVRARSRRREFAADDRAAEVTGDPMALARALRRIERATEPTWPFAPVSTRKRTDDPAERWLSTHPSTDERVERLRQRAASQESGQRIPLGPSE